MSLFGLTLVGEPSPLSSLSARHPSGLSLPRVYLDLMRCWGPGRIAGEFSLHPPEQLHEMAFLFEREAEIDPELSTRSPAPSMPLEEWKGLASFASRDRLELAWVRGQEQDGPLWAVDVSMRHFVRVGTFAELPHLLDQIEQLAPPGPGLRWGFPRTFVTPAETARTAEYERALDEGPDAVSAALPAWEERSSAYSIYANAIELARAEDDGSERARAVLALLEARATSRLGRVPV